MFPLLIEPSITTSATSTDRNDADEIYYDYDDKPNKEDDVNKINEWFQDDLGSLEDIFESEDTIALPKKDERPVGVQPIAKADTSGSTYLLTKGLFTSNSLVILLSIYLALLWL